MYMKIHWTLVRSPWGLLVLILDCSYNFFFHAVSVTQRKYSLKKLLPVSLVWIWQNHVL